MALAKMPGDSPYMTARPGYSEDPVSFSSPAFTPHNEGASMGKPAANPFEEFAQDFGNFVQDAVATASWIGHNFVQNPVQTVAAVAQGINLNLNYGVDLTASLPDAPTDWKAWTPAQIGEAYEGTRQTANTLHHLISSDADIDREETFTAFTGPVTLQLGGVETPTTTFDEEADRSTILLPDNFTDADINGEKGRWALTGEYAKAIDYYSFGTLSEALRTTGTTYKGAYVSGRDEFNRQRWIYDEYGVYEFLDENAPEGAERYTYDNDTLDDELRDNFKQLVFLNEFAGDNEFESSEDLIEAIRISQEYHDHSDRMTLAQLVDMYPGSYDSDLITLSDDAAKMTVEEYHAYMEEEGSNARRLFIYHGDPTYGSMGIYQPENTLTSLINQYSDEYSDQQAELTTFFNRSEDTENALADALIVSTLWRDETFRSQVAADNYEAHQNIENLDGERFAWRNISSQSPDMLNIVVKDYFSSDASQSVTSNADGYNPTALYRQNKRQNEALMSLVGLTDWANTIGTPASGVLSGAVGFPESIYPIDHHEIAENVRANLPFEIAAASNHQLSTLVQGDLSDGDVDALRRTVFEYLYDNARSENDYYAPIRVDTPEVINHNVRTGMFLGVAAATTLVTPIGIAADVMDVVGSLARGDYGSAALSAAGVLLPEFLETGADLFRTGKQLAGAAIDSISSTQLANRAYNYAGQVVKRSATASNNFVGSIDELAAYFGALLRGEDPRQLAWNTNSGNNLVLMSADDLDDKKSNSGFWGNDGDNVLSDDNPPSTGNLLDDFFSGNRNNELPSDDTTPLPTSSQNRSTVEEDRDI
ncbi:MAG: hypothetical protein ACPG7F_13300, partial [Aggregatilineales bacterium]